MQSNNHLMISSISTILIQLLCRAYKRTYEVSGSSRKYWIKKGAHLLFRWSAGRRGAYRNFDLSNIFFLPPPLFIINDRSLMLLLSSVFSPIQQARYIDVSIGEFQKTFENFQLAWYFLMFFLPFYGHVNWSHRKMGT